MRDTATEERAAGGLRTPLRAIAILLGALLFVQLWLAVVPDAFEYNIVSPKDEALATEMRRLGAVGWEIVSARRATSSDGEGARYELILKKRRWWLIPSIVPESPIALPPQK
jgi:hypothetical protein